jgi:hypothetical protein
MRALGSDVKIHQLDSSEAMKKSCSKSDRAHYENGHNRGQPLLLWSDLIRIGSHIQFGGSHVGDELSGV